MIKIDQEWRDFVRGVKRMDPVDTVEFSRPTTVTLKRRRQKPGHTPKGMVSSIYDRGPHLK